VTIITHEKDVEILFSAAREVDQLDYTRVNYVAVAHIMRAVAPDWYTAQSALVALTEYLRSTGSDDSWVSTWTGTIERGAAAELLRAAARQAVTR
jgi:hypothetical protein